MNYSYLIIKFFTKEISDEELILLKSWLDLHAENRHIFDQQNELWQAARIKSNLDQPKLDIAWKNVSNRIGLDNNGRDPIIILKKNKFRILLAAATVAFIIGIGGLSNRIVKNQSVQDLKTALTKITTKEGERANIYLSDSTQIILNSVSTLQFSNDYNNSDRFVTLSGEAYFDVNTNPDKPFVVQLDQMRITATGTRFNVYSFLDEGRIETTLEEGVIRICIQGLEPILVKSGQQVVFIKSSKKVKVLDVNTYTYTSWRENKLQFRDTPLEEVLRQIGRKYKVNFEITDHNLLNLEYTATFFDESIEEVMQMLKTVSPIDYRIKDHSENNGKYVKPKIIIGKRKV